MHAALIALTRCEANDTVANSRKVAEFASRDYFSWKMLSVGTSSRDRTMGIPRAAL